MRWFLAVLILASTGCAHRPPATPQVLVVADDTEQPEPPPPTPHPTPQASVPVAR